MNDGMVGKGIFNVVIYCRSGFGGKEVESWLLKSWFLRISPDFSFGDIHIVGLTQYGSTEQINIVGLTKYCSTEEIHIVGLTQNFSFEQFQQYVCLQN